MKAIQVATKRTLPKQIIKRMKKGFVFAKNLKEALLEHGFLFGVRLKRDVKLHIVIHIGYNSIMAKIEPLLH